MNAESDTLNLPDAEQDIVAVDDDPIAELIERCFGVRGVVVDNYVDVQRVFGWDDTH